MTRLHTVIETVRTEQELKAVIETSIKRERNIINLCNQSTSI